jgi:hypothetical protein
VMLNVVETRRSPLKKIKGLQISHELYA